MENYLIKDIQKLNKQHNFNFKKRLGQNFLIDVNILDNIVKNANIDFDTLVIEIGTGAGALTKKLALNSKQVVTYEIDKNLKPFLNELFRNDNNIETIFDDFLDRDISKDIEKYSYKRLSIIANIPYYITTPIINKILTANINVENIIFMIQKEAIDRLLAKPGTKDYNYLPIVIDYYFEFKKLFPVSRNCFYPMPAVDSVIIELKHRNEKKVFVNNEKLFLKLINDAFYYKRKNLRNNLRDYNLKLIEEVLKKYNLDLNVRAEALSIDIFSDIANKLSQN
jgi:16S rRNA (adenine1518-N6/adenine1519-N6)-dimethyltransferase